MNPRREKSRQATIDLVVIVESVSETAICDAAEKDAAINVLWQGSGNIRVHPVQTPCAKPLDALHARF